MKKVNLKPLKEHLPEILTGVGVGTEALASILYIYNSKKLYEKKELTKKDYVKAYALPVVLSSTSIAAIIFSNRLQQKEKARLLALNAAIVASSLKSKGYSKELESHVDPKEVQEIQAKLTQRDLEGMIDEAVKEDDLNEKALNDINIYFFPQVRKMIFAKEEDICRAIQCLNDELTENEFASFADFFDYIPRYDKGYNTDEHYHFPDLEELGWEECYGLELSTYVREVNGFPVTYVNLSIDPLYKEELQMYYDWIKKIREQDAYEQELPFKEIDY